MVRLLQDDDGDFAACHMKFQSHNGAIAASWKESTRCCRQQFQSHNGAIAALVHGEWEVVRKLFQSHNGAIAAASQSHAEDDSLVSIPQWCDCCD